MKYDGFIKLILNLIQKLGAISLMLSSVTSAVTGFLF